MTRLQEESEVLSGRKYFIQRCTAAKIIAEGILGIASLRNCHLLQKSPRNVLLFEIVLL